MQDSRQRHLLFLPAGQLERRLDQKILHPHDGRRALHPGQHLLPGHGPVFQGKCDILPHGQPHELGIRILLYGSHMLADLEDAGILRLDSRHFQGALDLALVGKWNQPVNAVSECGFPTPAGAKDQDFFTLVQSQIDMM